MLMMTTTRDSSAAAFFCCECMMLMGACYCVCVCVPIQLCNSVCGFGGLVGLLGMYPVFDVMLF